VLSDFNFERIIDLANLNFKKVVDNSSFRQHREKIRILVISNRNELKFSLFLVSWG
jgi:hypothetical protein